MNGFFYDRYLVNIYRLEIPPEKSGKDEHPSICHAVVGMGFSPDLIDESTKNKIQPYNHKKESKYPKGDEFP
jgi:hypothetical protein